MVTTILEKRGFEVVVASDGQEAYELAIETRPQLLITDVLMPNWDGWTLVKELRSLPEFAFVPVIFLTALMSDEDRIRGFRLGADDYLPKPFQFEELDLRVCNTMKRVEQLAAATRQQLEHSTSHNGGQSDIVGQLSEVGISSLLSLFELEKKSGTLMVMQESGAEIREGARISLRHGQPIAAEIVGDCELRNELAIYRILTWSEGTFAFEAIDHDCEVEILDSTRDILQEGARRIDLR